MTGLRSLTTAQETGAHGWTGPSPGGPLPDATSSAIVLAQPAGLQVGDILVAEFSAFGLYHGSGNYQVIPDTGVGTVAWNSAPSTTNVSTWWRVADSSDLALGSYPFHSVKATNTAVALTTLMNGVMMAFEGFATPVSQISLGASSALVTQTNSQFSPGYPPVPDLGSLNLHGTETTTGGLLVYAWLTFESIEYSPFHPSTGGNPNYPASTPYQTTTLTGSVTQHQQLHWEGLVHEGSTEYDPAFNITGVQYVNNNQMLTVGSQVVPAGTLPDAGASFTWQHAGDEAGFNEVAAGVRILLRAALATVAVYPYWGILNTPG